MSSSGETWFASASSAATLVCVLSRNRRPKRILAALWKAHPRSGSASTRSQEALMIDPLPLSSAFGILDNPRRGGHPHGFWHATSNFLSTERPLDRLCSRHSREASDRSAEDGIKRSEPVHPVRLALSDLLRYVGANDTLARRSLPGRGCGMGYVGQSFGAATLTVTDQERSKFSAENHRS